MKDFNNRYFALRHGFSRANESNLIVSNLKYGCTDYGLTDRGKKEVEESINQFLLDNNRDNDLIISSPFLRTKESALIASTLLDVDVVYNKELRERYFGRYDMGDNTSYFDIWKLDSKNPRHKTNGVESVKEVYQRVQSVILDLEREYEGCNIILVSHGDSLQILECFFKVKDPALHRDLDPLKPGECRILV